MLDMKKLGIKICAFRKKAGYSQEKLANLLRISPQAISKWENGHSVPDTLLLPVLAQIFGCTIDEIITPAYSFDEQIEIEKITSIEQQAEHIAQIIITKIEETNMNKNIGLSDQEIIDAVKKIHPDSSNFEITRSTPDKNNRFTTLYIIVKTSHTELKVVERIYSGDDRDLRNHTLLSDSKVSVVPTIYYINTERKILLIEDLTSDYFKGSDVMNIVAGWDKNHENGKIYYENLKLVLKSAAEFHSAFWGNAEVLEMFGVDRKFETKENMIANISVMEKSFKKYKKNYKPGATWEHHTDDIKEYQLDYFERAIEYLKEEYVKYVETRFDVWGNITVINGELEPIQTYMHTATDRAVKISPQGLRVGLCTENLAELLALHVEPDKKVAEPLLKYYHECLCRNVNVKDYSYDTFIHDYKVSIAEYMFKPIGLANHGINDFPMRDRAVKAFETFVLEK